MDEPEFTNESYTAAEVKEIYEKYKGSPTGLVKDDGSFSENWKETLDESIREEKMLDNLGDFHGLMKQFVHAQKNIGKDKVVMPNEKSTENDWNAFYKATGRPDTPDEYKFDKDEELNEYYNDDILKTFMEGAHKAGITTKQMAFLNNFENERIRLAVELQKAEEQRLLREAQEASDAKWGAAKDQRLHLANLFVNENTAEGEDREALLARVGNDPIVADLFATAAKKYIAEHKAIAGQMKEPTPNEALAKIAELQNTEGYMTGQLASSNPGRHKAIKEEIAALYKKAYPG